MAQMSVSKWAIVLALQRRLDIGAVGFYEAVLARNALNGLFYSTGRATESTAGFSSADLWVESIKNKLDAIVSGVPCESSTDDWAVVWMAQKTTDQIVAEKDVDKLMASAERS